jgi:hypothetical protein
MGMLFGCNTTAYRYLIFAQVDFCAYLLVDTCSEKSHQVGLCCTTILVYLELNLNRCFRA